MSETVINLIETIKDRLDNIQYFVSLLEDNKTPINDIKEHMDKLWDELSSLNEKYEDTHE